MDRMTNGLTKSKRNIQYIPHSNIELGIVQCHYNTVIFLANIHKDTPQLTR